MEKRLKTVLRNFSMIQFKLPFTSFFWNKIYMMLMKILSCLCNNFNDISSIKNNQSEFSHLRTLTFQKMRYFLDWRLFKNDEKCFYFILKSLFVLKIPKFFVLAFWSYRKNSLIRKIRLTSKFMTSQPGLQAIAMHILPNIPQSKGNQTVKFGQFIEYKKINIFLQNLCRKWGRDTSTRPLFVCLKKHYMR